MRQILVNYACDRSSEEASSKRPLGNQISNSPLKSSKCSCRLGRITNKAPAVSIAQKDSERNKPGKPENHCDGLSSENAKLVRRVGKFPRRENEIDKREDRPDRGED